MWLTGPRDATVPLAEASKAHELLEDRSRTGRILLVP
jgi:hypothetical protein